jgi:Major Facilitator Superfamily
VPGTVTAVTGLFAIVYGFNNAERHSWSSTATIACVAGIGTFGAFFFLTFYLQQTLGYSPVKTGVAFLPQVAAVMVTATTSSALLLPRIGPRPLMATGLVVAAAGMVLLTQVGVHSSYAGHILPGLLVTGLGLGLAISVALNTGTLGVTPADAGVASATVNTMQQIGGSLGTALLSTVSASAASGYLAGKQPATAVAAQATVHGYTVAFWWSAAFFAVGAVLCGLLLRSGRLQPVAETSPLPV